MTTHLGGLDESGVTHDRFEDHGRDITAFDELLDIREVVVGGHKSVLGGTLGHACERSKNFAMWK